MAVKDPAAKAATAVYSDFHRSLLREAQDEERDRHPMAARKLRYKAAIVARAALAEELDPAPSTVPSYRQYSDERGQ